MAANDFAAIRVKIKRAVIKLLTMTVPKLAPLVAGVSVSSLAFAAAASTDSHSDGSDTLATVVTLVLGVGAAYLLAHFVVDGLQKRFLISTNVEYVALGVLLGPSVAAIPAFQDLTPIAPIIALELNSMFCRFFMIFYKIFEINI